MQPDIIPLSEAFEDTPLFRERLIEEEARVRGCNDQILKIVSLQRCVAQQIEELSKQRVALIKMLDQPLFDEKIAGPLHIFQRNLKEIEERKVLQSLQMETVLLEPLLEFQGELEEAGTLAKKFRDADALLASTTEKYLVNTTSKADDSTEKAEGVATARKGLHQVAVELGTKLNTLRRKRMVQVSEYALAFVYTEMAFYHQSYEQLAGLQPIMDAMSDQLKGYLDTDLLKYKTSLDLRICMVRILRNEQRPNLFEIVTPAETHTLQALSAADFNDWVSKINASIASALQHGDHGSASSSREGLDEEEEERKLKMHPSYTLIAKLHGVQGNKRCADCGVAEDVVWASVNLGLLLCIGCSGLHRGLGSHISKIRSLTLDRWLPETVDVMLSLGNQMVNGMLERTLSDDDGTKPTQESTNADKETFLNAKYVKHQYLTLPEDNTIAEQFMPAVKSGDLPTVLWTLLFGLNLNEPDIHQKSAIHYAAERRDGRMVEFLLIWGADINAVDREGKTALHYAADLGDASLVTLLIKRGAKVTLDKEERSAEDIALDKSHQNEGGEGYVQIVTILRLLKLRAEEGSSTTWQSSADFDDLLTEMDVPSSSTRSNFGITSTVRSRLPSTTPEEEVLPWADSNVWAA
ncbi:Arf-GAP with coiled-coil, ANK repeat and PH domain-containing protein 2 [Chytridiales sp. JEL 0842]|nr:Arf-GAP with coiled-coil, ANK repeat and PH domain-containing protein 2 [Chytridiales sp. JEL 0842]